jgi:hypothetical protein
VLRAIATQSMEFREHSDRVRLPLRSSAVIADGAPAPDPLDDVRVHVPSTRPGSPLPHAVVEDADGRRSSTLDLVAPGRFVLIAGEDGAAWCDAALALAKQHDSRSTQCASAISTATTATRAARGSCGAASARGARARAPRPLRGVAKPRRGGGPGRGARQALARVLGVAGSVVTARQPHRRPPPRDPRGVRALAPREGRGGRQRAGAARLVARELARGDGRERRARRRSCRCRRPACTSIREARRRGERVRWRAR